MDIHHIVIPVLIISGFYVAVYNTLPDFKKGLIPFIVNPFILFVSFILCIAIVVTYIWMLIYVLLCEEKLKTLQDSSWIDLIVIIFPLTISLAPLFAMCWIIYQHWKNISKYRKRYHVKNEKYEIEGYLTILREAIECKKLDQIPYCINKLINTEKEDIKLRVLECAFSSRWYISQELSNETYLLKYIDRFKHSDDKVSFLSSCLFFDGRIDSSISLFTSQYIIEPGNISNRDNAVIQSNDIVGKIVRLYKSRKMKPDTLSELTVNLLTYTQDLKLTKRTPTGYLLNRVFEASVRDELHDMIEARKLYIIILYEIIIRNELDQACELLQDSMRSQPIQWDISIH